MLGDIPMVFIRTRATPSETDLVAWNNQSLLNCTARGSSNHWCYSEDMYRLTFFPSITQMTIGHLLVTTGFKEPINKLRPGTHSFSLVLYHDILFNTVFRLRFYKSWWPNSICNPYHIYDYLNRRFFSSCTSHFVEFSRFPSHSSTVSNIVYAEDMLMDYILYSLALGRVSLQNHDSLSTSAGELPKSWCSSLFKLQTSFFSILDQISLYFLDAWAWMIVQGTSGLRRNTSPEGTDFMDPLSY